MLRYLKAKMLFSASLLTVSVFTDFLIYLHIVRSTFYFRVFYIYRIITSRIFVFFLQYLVYSSKT